LPKGFKKVRRFGYLSARNKQLLPLPHYVFDTAASLAEKRKGRW